jgi:hypothetical protein
MLTPRVIALTSLPSAHARGAPIGSLPTQQSAATTGAPAR